MSETIVRLAARGDGVTVSGKFVAGAAPGDMLADDGSVIAGPHRQAPPCRHFGPCGGCQLQHIDDAAYSAFVTDRIVTSLSAQGVPSPAIRAPHLSPPLSRRRVTLKASRRGKAVTLGFNEARSHRLIDVRECPIMAPRLFDLLQPLRLLLAGLLRENRMAAIGMTVADQGVDLSLEGVDDTGLAAAQALTDFAQTYRLARLSIDDGFGMQPRWEPQPVTITLGEVAVPFPAGAFLQATPDGERCLVSAVREAVGQASHIADLFAGLGTFAFSLAARVHAVEGARDAFEALQAAARVAGRPVTAEHRDLFRRPLTATDLTRFDAVVIDPPRAGAAEQAALLATSPVRRIAYVSCNPATFARDAKALMADGYRLDWIQPVGQFRWSTHVELAAAFSR